MSVAFRRFTRDNLNLKKGKVPELQSKGYDTYVCLKWLKQEFTPTAGLEVEYALLWFAEAFLQVLTCGEAFLSNEAAEHMKLCGEMYLKLWLWKVHEQPAFFKVRPKLHMVHHIIMEACYRPSHRNCNADSTWMDEDWMKKVARTIRRTHKRTTPLTGIQRYLVHFMQKLRERR